MSRRRVSGEPWISAADTERSAALSAALADVRRRAALVRDCAVCGRLECATDCPMRPVAPEGSDDAHR